MKTSLALHAAGQARLLPSVGRGLCPPPLVILSEAKNLTNPEHEPDAESHWAGHEVPPYELMITGA